MIGGQLDFYVNDEWKGKIGDLIGTSDLRLQSPGFTIGVNESEFFVTNNNTGKSIFVANSNSINFGGHTLAINQGSWYLDGKKIAFVE